MQQKSHITQTVCVCVCLKALRFGHQFAQDGVFGDGISACHTVCRDSVSLYFPTGFSINKTLTEWV